MTGIDRVLAECLSLEREGKGQLTLAATLQGFPETWVFCGKTKASRSAQIGMAMPPPMAEAVARSIVAWFASIDLCDCDHSQDEHDTGVCSRCSCARFRSIAEAAE